MPLHENRAVDGNRIEGLKSAGRREHQGDRIRSG